MKIDWLEELVQQDKLKKVLNDLETITWEIPNIDIVKLTFPAPPGFYRRSK